MCNAYKLRNSVDEIIKAFSEARLSLELPEGAPNLEPRDDVRITERAPIVQQAAGGGDLVMRTWSWRGPQGKPVYNFRSEGRRFQSGRCLIPAEAFYEFTDPLAPAPKRARKLKWAFSLVDAPILCIAGIVRKDAWTMLTTEPGPDIAAYHARQVVVLNPRDWAAWLSGAPNEAELLRPLPAGSLSVERVA